MHYATRPVTAEDESFLWEMLYYAAHMDEGGEPPASAKTNPDLAPYVTQWGKVGDRGVLAVESTNGHMIGAAWVRLMPDSSPLYRFVAATLPELAIAVAPAHLGKGVGSRLLTTLLPMARDVHRGVVLSVRASNPAKRLYERLGFTVVGELTNRVGGRSFVMKIDLV